MKLIAALASLVLASAAYAFSFGIVTSSNGEKRSEYWDGSYVAGASDCPSDLDRCEAYGADSVQSADLSPGVRLTRGTGTGTGYSSAQKDYADEDDVHAEACATHDAATAGGLYAAAIVTLVEGGASESADYRSDAVYFPGNDAVYARTVTAGTQGNVVQGTTDADPCLLVEHDASTNETRIAQSDDGGMTWDLIGSPIIRDYGASRAMMLVSTTNGTTLSSFDFTYSFTNTLELSGSGTDPDPGEQFITNQTGGPPWPSGVWADSVSRYTDFVSSAGYEPDVVSVIGSWQNSTWTSLATGAIASNNRAVIDAIPITTAVHIIFPPIPSQSGATNKYCSRPSTWTEIAAGTYDSTYTAAATAWKSMMEGYQRDPANTIIRLGHEMDGGWYPWSICGVEPSVFKASWARIVGLMRAVIPGLKFDFSVARHYACYTWPTPGSQNPYVFEYDMAGHSGGCPLDEFAPDSDYWNVITVGIHDDAPKITNEASWAQHDYAPVARTFGLKAACDIAITEGRLCGSTEWAPYMAVTSTCGTSVSTNPTYIVSRTYQFFWENQDRIGIDTYFNMSCTRPFPSNYWTLFGSGAAP